MPFCPAASLLPQRWVRVFNGQLLEQGGPAVPAAARDALEVSRGAGGSAVDGEDAEEFEDVPWELLGSEPKPAPEP